MENPVPQCANQRGCLDLPSHTHTRWVKEGAEDCGLCSVFVSFYLLMVYMRPSGFFRYPCAHLFFCSSELHSSERLKIRHTEEVIIHFRIVRICWGVFFPISRVFAATLEKLCAYTQRVTSASGASRNILIHTQTAVVTHAVPHHYRLNAPTLLATWVVLKQKRKKKIRKYWKKKFHPNLFTPWQNISFV